MLPSSIFLCESDKWLRNISRPRSLNPECAGVSSPCGCSPLSEAITCCRTCPGLCWGEGSGRQGWHSSPLPSPLEPMQMHLALSEALNSHSKAVAAQSAKVCVTGDLCCGLGGRAIARPSVWGQAGPWEDREDGEDPWGPLAVCPPLICVPGLSSLTKFHLPAQTPRIEGPEGLVCLPEAGGADHVHLCSPFQAAPSAPGRVFASRDTKTSVVVRWDRPRQDEDLLGYYVDCCVAGSNIWEPCNHKPIGYNRCCAREPRPPSGGQVQEAEPRHEAHAEWGTGQGEGGLGSVLIRSPGRPALRSLSCVLGRRAFPAAVKGVLELPWRFWPNEHLN